MNKNIPLQIFENLQQDPKRIFLDGEIDIKSYSLTQNGYSIDESTILIIKDGGLL